jgi:L-ascorbate metabolism protein UlaG (beta-lactamase superfamily)
MAKLLYQGHGSYRITTQSGIVIFIDPFSGSGYESPADLVLVTHEHPDHNNITLITRKENCCIIRVADALKNGEYRSFLIDDVAIEAVEAYNQKHKKSECVGYILTVDQVSIYAAGDTSETGQMKSFADRKLDYALLPIDGIYNMGPAEASKCADLIGAKHTIPIHMKPGKPFDLACAESFQAAGRLIVKPGEIIDL